MSGEKTTSPCGKFQANIFNKSKCQNCFKSRELHLLTDTGMEQAKPLYGGWLCLAPEGTDFDNPMQRSRKWQRRFFILYEDGSLSFALDELPSTLPQGTLHLDLTADIGDAEPRTGQRNALCIATPEQHIFIRGDSRDIINGWTEQLAVYLQTNKQNQKKKRRVEPAAAQELSAAADQSDASICWGEETMRTEPDPRGLEESPADNSSSCRSPASLDLLTSGDTASKNQLDLLTSGDTASRNQLAEANDIQTAANRIKSHAAPTERILGSEPVGKEPGEGTAVSRTGRSEARPNKREELQPCGDLVQPCGDLVQPCGDLVQPCGDLVQPCGDLVQPCGDLVQPCGDLVPQRRARSLDRRTSDTVMPPDLLNFKKGWMVKLDENEQWKKFWFVLSMDTLRCYKDSVAEEASDLDAEIDLTKCSSVSEFQVQRNYGFQIHTPQGVFTLSAMTSGIRRNWIQALMKNIRPAAALDVASVLHGPCSAPAALSKPDVTQDSPASAERDPRKHRSVMQRRREGRYRTFDWAEFRPQNRRALDTQRTAALCSLQLGELDRRSRREQRRRCYEGMLGFPLGRESRALSPRSQQRVEEEMEECWKLVEKTAFRLERNVPLIADAKDAEEAEKLLDGYRTGVEDLKAQLEESERLRLELQAQPGPAALYPAQPGPAGLYPARQQPDPPLTSSNMNEKPPCEGTRELLEEQNRINAQEQLGPASEKQLLFPQSGQTADVNQNHLDSSDREQVPISETQIDDGDFGSLVPQPSEGVCVELLVPPVVRRLSRELELLTGQNQALDQRNQEMLNQLTEADREIERLKAELQYAKPHRLPEAEQLARTRVQDLESELTSRDRRLLEAQTRIASLEENVREMEVLLRPDGPREPEETGLGNKGYLLRCFEATEAKLTELERKLDQSEWTCGELRAQNAELRAAEERHGQTNEERQGQTNEERQGQTTEERQGQTTEERQGQTNEERQGQTTEERQGQTTEERQGQTNEERQGQTTEERQGQTNEERQGQTTEEETDIRRLEEELEKTRGEDGESSGCVSGEERIQQVIDGMVMRLKALKRLLEVMKKFDFGEILVREEEETPTVESQLRWEEEFWGFLLDKLKAEPSEELLLLSGEKPVEEELRHLAEEELLLLSQVTQRMMAEQQMLLLGHRLSETSAGTRLKEPDVIWSIGSETETSEMEESRMSEFNHQMECFRSATRVKISLLNRLASSIGSSAHDALRLTADRLQERPGSGFLHSTATQALHCCQMSLLRSRYRSRREETEQNRLTSALVSMEENRELRARLSELEAQQTTPSWDKTDRYSQTEEAHPQVTGVTLQDTGVTLQDTGVTLPDTGGGATGEAESLESHSCAEGQVGIQETADGNTGKSDASHEEVEPLGEEAEPLGEEVEPLGVEVEPLGEEAESLGEEVEPLGEEAEPLGEEVESLGEEALRRRVEQLEEQLAATAEELKEEHDGKISSVLQHETEMETLKVTCERGFACMEASHLKVVEELQRRQQQEVERLLVERDGLLEEESVATATALAAVQKAQRLQLEKHKRCLCQSGSGDAHLEDALRRHREELASYLRELEVLSQQFSLKCLENGHLVQALDAERKALCQCQQENQDLRTRNQELSGRLSAEISRLCSLAQQDQLPLRPDMGVYQMEITLRVKESELQGLKQEITSLRDDLQTALRDKRSATKKSKDLHTELSISRAKAERDTDQLREHLRLTRQVLDRTLDRTLDQTSS